jgi:tetratricopeptide (TPR) repeat protein
MASRIARVASDTHTPQANVTVPSRKRAILLLYILLNLLIVPVLALALAEGVLRAINYGYPSRFFVRETVDGKACYVTNYKFAWRFFPRSMARLPAPLAVPVDKSPDTLRVFILGSSAAQGDPGPTFSFSRILEVMLRERYPGKKIEVYNTAATAINSNVILPIARDCLDLKPDIFVIYAGNNEVIGPFGLSAVLSPFFSSREAIKTRVWVGQTKVGQFARSLSEQKAATEQEWNGMELFLKNKIRHDNPDLNKIYDHFEGNLSEICELARGAGVKVVLATVAVNDRDCPPFISLHNPAVSAASLEQWEALYADGKKMEAAGRPSEALAAYSKAAGIDDSYAELPFRMGRCQLVIGETNKAADSLAKARDCDALRFRADTQINRAVRNAATAHPETVLVDFASKARAASPEGVPGASLFYEHVHLNFDGNYLLASAVLEPVEKALGLQNPRSLPDVEACKKALAFTPFCESRVVESVLKRVEIAPFTGRDGNVEEIQRAQGRLAALKSLVNPQNEESVFEKAIVARPNDPLLHLIFIDYLMENAQTNRALAEAEASYRFAPFEYLTVVNLGAAHFRLKHFAEAERYLNQAISFNPYFTRAYEQLASVYEEQKNYDKAAEMMDKGRAGSKTKAVFYNRVGVALAKERQYDQAIASFQNALKFDPNMGEAQTNLVRCIDQKDGKLPSAEASDLFNQANRLLKSNQFTNAVELYLQVVQMEPTHAKAQNNLGIALAQLKSYDEALPHFLEAIRLDPAMNDAYPNAGAVQSMKGNHAEALVLFKKGIEIKPSPQLFKLVSAEYLKMGNTNEARLWYERSQAK